MMEVQSLSGEGLGKLPLIATLILRHVQVNSAKILRNENYLSINNSHAIAFWKCRPSKLLKYEILQGGQLFMDMKAGLTRK